MLVARGELEAAAKRVARSSAAETDKDKARADRLQVAELLFRRGDYEGAAASYLALRADPGRLGAKALQGLAWCAFELGDDQSCDKRIAAALAHPKIADGEPVMLELLSSLHHRMKDWKGAEAAAKRFLASFAEHPRADNLRYALGVALARDQRLQEARQVLEPMVRSGGSKLKLERPDRLYYELAWLRRRSNDEVGALRAFAEVARISKDPALLSEARLHLGLAMLESLGTNDKNADDAKAAELLEAVKGRYRAQALYRLAFSRFERESYDAAAPLFEKIIALGPERGASLYDEALFFAGETAYRQHRRERARKAYRALLARAPDSARAQTARLHLGHVELEDGRANDALGPLKAWIRRGKDELQGDRAQAELWLGRAQHARKDWKAALVCYQRATQLSEGPLAAEAQYRIGETQYAAGDKAAAIDAWLKLSILYSQDIWVQKGLLSAARGYKALGQKKKARKFLRELIERYKDSAAAGEARTLLTELRGE